MRRSYDRTAVEALMHAIWDDSAVFGIRREGAPEPGSPKAKADPACGNTLYAMIADIKRAWQRAKVTPAERQALFLRFRLGYEAPEAAPILGVTPRAVNYRIYSGVGKLTAFLNGDKYHRDYLEQEQEGEDE